MTPRIDSHRLATWLGLLAALALWLIAATAQAQPVPAASAQASAAATAKAAKPMKTVKATKA